jgi:hypothetical protein
MMNLEEEISERIFSVRIYGNSKEFERLRTKMIFLLKRYFSDEEEDSEVLAQYHIVRNPGHVVLKGNGILKVKESILQISDFEEGITLTSRDVRNLEIISLEDMKIMTIENLTSFYQFHQEGVLSVYLGGYHNTIRRELLKKIYEKYPEKQYCHFGDIDAGGFYILNHLIERTGIPFSAFCMDTDTLQKYKEKWLPLSEHDRVRLDKLISKSEYRDVIQYMLDHNCKLEQENIIL